MDRNEIIRLVECGDMPLNEAEERLDHLDNCDMHESEWCVWIIVGTVLACIIFGAVT